jgi:hypothetical protein
LTLLLAGNELATAEANGDTGSSMTPHTMERSFLCIESLIIIVYESIGGKNSWVEYQQSRIL